ncbi:hypothetical protein D3C76_1009520 [compost metagenome]
MLPALYLDRLQAAVSHQFGQRHPALPRFQAKVVAQVALGGHAQGAGSVQHQALLRLGLAGQWLVEDHLWQDLVRYIVEPLEATSASHRHLTGGEQPFQRVLFLAPVPPRAGPLLAGGQAARAEGALFTHSGQHTGDHLLPLTAKLRELAVDATASGGVGHAPAQQGVQRQRQQRGFVAPVFEQLALTAMAPGELVKGDG